VTNEARVPTRMGDGTFVYLTRSEIRVDLVAGSEAAAKRAKVPLLTDDEIDHLLDIYASPLRFIGVDVGDEIVLSCDGTGMKTHATRIQDLQTYEQWMGADLLELCVGDYSLKVVRTILAYEAQYMHDAQLATIAPLQYGVMPNLGLYSKPDGPCENWNELLPQGRIPEARAAAEQAVEMAVVDMVNLADSQWEAGADAIDWDTTGASGDPEFLAALRATRIIREKHPDMGVQLGMAGEFVLGMHGQLEWDGVRLAGLWPREQMELVRRAGATIFGPAVNVNTRKSGAWNIARALTLVKPCMDVAEIPVHMNIGMGVGAVPISSYLPLDAVSRASRATVDILRLDGL
jgi:dimethylamine--corrinoid protein Co-methyltransferase